MGFGRAFRVTRKCDFLGGVGPLAIAIKEAARSASLEDLAELAFPALARALDATPTFFAEARADITRSIALAGDIGALTEYLKDFVMDDPMTLAALSSTEPVIVFEQALTPAQIAESRVFSEFHRAHDFEHHMLVRIFGDQLAMDGALAMGFTRGRHQRPFGAEEARIAEQALPAFHGAAERILGNGVASFAERKGLSRAEARVLAALALGLSNREIGRRLSVSIDTVKTHVSRIFQKLAVRTRAQVLLALQRGS